MILLRHHPLMVELSRQTPRVEPGLQMRPAPIAQWIERWPPEPETTVRACLGVPTYRLILSFSPIQPLSTLSGVLIYTS